MLVALVILAAYACRLCCYNVLTSASKIRCTLQNFEKRFEHSSKFRNISFEISRIFSNCRSNFRWNIRIQFRKCQDNSAFENSSKVRRYFVSFQKSLVFVEKWQNVSKFDSPLERIETCTALAKTTQKTFESF